MNVRIVKSSVYKEAPKYAKQGDAGIDLKADSIIKETESQIIYGTGLSIEIPEGFVGLVFPRSSLRKKGLVMANSVGVIDSGYRGEIQCTFIKTESCISAADMYQINDRICQIIIIPYPKITLIPVLKLNKTDRGTDGHGSTGTK